MKWTMRVCGVVLGILLVTADPAMQQAEAGPPGAPWYDQFGGPGDDTVLDTARWRDRLYVYGQASSQFGDAVPGDTLDGRDLYLRCYQLPEGTVLWTKIFGTSGNEVGPGGVDAYENGVYVTGSTTGAFAPHTNKGGTDVFVRKFNTKGKVRWTQMLGNASFDQGNAISVGDTGVYITGGSDALFDPMGTHYGSGDTTVARLRRGSGTLVWRRQFGDSQREQGLAIQVIDGLPGLDVVFGGDISEPSLGTSYRSSYLNALNKKGAQSLPSPLLPLVQSSSNSVCPCFDQVWGMRLVEDKLYVVGRTPGELNGNPSEGLHDGFIQIYQIGQPTLTWQFGTPDVDVMVDVTKIIGARTYAIGTRQEQLFGGNRKAYVVEFRNNGTISGSRTYDVSSQDEGISLEARGNGVIMAGNTRGSMAGLHHGGQDAWVMCFDRREDFPPPVADPAGVDPIVFHSQRGSNWDIYTMASDGSGVERITTHAADDTNPSWVPGNQKIVFNSERDGNREIYIMNADGTGLVNLTNHPGADSDPTVSPDGTKIAFHSNRDGGNVDVYVMDIDGNNVERLTDDPATDGSPSWSPDGKRLAFTSFRDGDAEIFTMRANNGKGLKKLTDNAVDDLQPFYSPDGKQIAFSSFRDGNLEVYRMRKNGSQVERLTADPAQDSASSWSNNGKRILVVSNRDGNFELYAIDASDGGNPTNLTNALAWDSQGRY